MNTDLTDVNSKIIEWAKARNIIGDSDGLTQVNKTLEEVYELRDALLAKDRAEVIDAIGDTYVTLAIIAEMENLTMKECVESAYDSIKDRKGKLINGIFVKEEDLKV